MSLSNATELSGRNTLRATWAVVEINHHMSPPIPDRVRYLASFHLTGDLLSAIPSSEDTCLLTLESPADHALDCGDAGIIIEGPRLSPKAKDHNIGGSAALPRNYQSG